MGNLLEITIHYLLSKTYKYKLNSRVKFRLPLLNILVIILYFNGLRLI